eukprot:TRINITY_DN380_c0_g1_i2.p2 TRINITY_DN380_c0_g1~~TRINITY_DN380_c0_g1_i2.p2  ORF type:complete len:158 (-),score=3.47 TRINITY_DN380_c0_g1_i2:451-924(-)
MKTNRPSVKTPSASVAGGKNSRAEDEIIVSRTRGTRKGGSLIVISIRIRIRTRLLEIRSVLRWRTGAGTARILASATEIVSVRKRSAGALAPNCRTRNFKRRGAAGVEILGARNGPAIRRTAGLRRRKRHRQIETIDKRQVVEVLVLVASSVERIFY